MKVVRVHTSSVRLHLFQDGTSQPSNYIQSQKIAETRVTLTHIGNIKLLVVLRTPVLSIFLFVHVPHTKVECGCHQNDAAGKAAADGVASDEERPVWIESAESLRTGTQRFLRFSIWENGRTEERATLTEYRKDGQTGATLGLVGVVVQQPSDLFCPCQPGSNRRERSV